MSMRILNNNSQPQDMYDMLISGDDPLYNDIKVIVKMYC